MSFRTLALDERSAGFYMKAQRNQLVQKRSKGFSPIPGSTNINIRKSPGYRRSITVNVIEQPWQKYIYH